LLILLDGPIKNKKKCLRRLRQRAEQCHSSDALGVAQNRHSDTKTIAHLLNLDKLLTQFKGKNLQIEYDLCKLIIDCKILKIESQSGALAADCIPSNVLSGVAAIGLIFAHGQSLAQR
jgi:hypothetical protein